MPEIDITLVIVFVVGLVFGLISQGSQVVQSFVRAQKSRVPEEWHWALDDVAAIGVRAAEQIWQSNKDEVFDRFEYAKNIVSDEAARRGVVYDDDMITALVESKVYEILNSDKELG
jgi:hypothetical protein